MDRIFDMMAHWTPLGQGIFFLMVMGAILYTFRRLLFYIAVIINDWPPCTCCDKMVKNKDDDEEDAE